MPWSGALALHGTIRHYGGIAMDATTDIVRHHNEPYRENLNLGEVAVFLDVGLTTVRDMIRNVPTRLSHFTSVNIPSAR